MIKTIRMLAPIALFIVASSAGAIANPLERKEHLRLLSLQILEKKAELASANLEAYQEGSLKKMIESPLGMLYVFATEKGIASTAYLATYAYTKKLNIKAQELMMKLRKQLNGQLHREQVPDAELQKHQAEADETLAQCNHVLCDVKNMAKATAALFAGLTTMLLKGTYEMCKKTAPIRQELAELQRQKNVLLMIR